MVSTHINSRYNKIHRKVDIARIKQTFAMNYFYWAFKEPLEILMATW